MHSMFTNTVRNTPSLGSDSSENWDKEATPICLHFIRPKYDMDESSAVIICRGKKLKPLVPEIANTVSSSYPGDYLC